MYTNTVETDRQEEGRAAQRRRTRAAILKAAGELVAEGKTPTVAEAAEAADVSRRTAYRYFPSQEQLLTEVVLESLRPEMERAVAESELSGDVEARVDGLVRAMLERARTHESLLRTMIRLTVAAPGQSAGDGGPAVRPRRGYRRIEWIELALDPIRADISEGHFQRLVSALAVCVGIEARLVLRDIRGLSEEESVDVSRWAALALLRATLSEGDPPRNR